MFPQLRENASELFSMLIRVDYTGKSCFAYLDPLLYE